MKANSKPFQSRARNSGNSGSRRYSSLEKIAQMLRSSDHTSTSNDSVQTLETCSHVQEQVSHLLVFTYSYVTVIYKRPKKHLKNEQRSRDAAANKRANTSGVGKINNYCENIYVPPYNTH